MSKGPVSQFIQHHYRHFNAAALVDAAKGYETHLLEGGKMMITLAGAMSTAELGIILAEMIRQDKVAYYQLHRRQPGRRYHEPCGTFIIINEFPITAILPHRKNGNLLENHYNRVTDTCIPEEEAFRRIQKHIV